MSEGRYVQPAIVLTGERAALLALAGRLLRQKFRAESVYLPPEADALFSEIEAVARSNAAISTQGGNHDDGDGNPGTLEYMNAEDAGAFLGLTSKRVRQLANDGDLVGEPSRAGWVFQRSDVEAFAATRRSA